MEWAGQSVLDDATWEPGRYLNHLWAKHSGQVYSKEWDGEACEWQGPNRWWKLVKLFRCWLERLPKVDLLALGRAWLLSQDLLQKEDEMELYSVEKDGHSTSSVTAEYSVVATAHLKE